MSNQRFVAWLLVGVLCVAGLLTRSMLQSPEGDELTNTSRPTIDFIVAGPDPFYQIVVSGARAAADDYDVDLHVHVPSGSPEGQTALLTRVAAQGSDGVAISPLDPRDQSRVLSKLATKAHLVTYDNDASQSLRHCYVGTNNYDAGVLCARAIRDALPDGATIVLFIGDSERENAIQRRRGVIEGLMEGRAPQGEVDYPLNEVVEAGAYRVVATYVDNQDADAAEANAAQSIEEHPEATCMVGLYGYNGPACLRAARDAGAVDKLTIIAFDAHDETLDGVAEGDIAATIVQDPYQYGFESVRLLSSLHKRRDHAVPLAGGGSIYLPCKKIDKSTVRDYRERLTQRIGAAEELVPEGAEASAEETVEG